MEKSNETTQPEPVDHHATTASGVEKVSVESTRTDCRHCAYCLKVCPVPAKLCSGCKRRAYCSRECQTIDWKVGKNQIGQGHKNWCKQYEYGEEDIDWEVVPVPGKGLGIVAKKPMPSKYLILIEPPITFPYDYPRVKDLHPEGASIQEKIKNNLIEADRCTRFSDHLALRISRLNHSCTPNAGVVYDDGARCEILFAQRDIQPGEEICVPYFSTFKDCLRGREREYSFDNMETFASALEKKRYEFMMSEWGFVCPDDCLCRQESYKKLLKRSRVLSANVGYFSQLGKYSEALECMNETLKLQDELGCSAMSKASMHHSAFEIARRDPKHSREAFDHVRKAFETYFALCPYSSLAQQAEQDFKFVGNSALRRILGNRYDPL